MISVLQCCYGIRNTQPCVIIYRFIFEFFEAAGISVSTHIQFVDQCSKAISFLSSGLQSAHRSGGYLQKFMDAVKVMAS